MSPSLKRILFALFFLSGFCSLLYQVVWIRMAYASFGVITPVFSMVISAFMLGLAAGSYGGGKLINRPALRHGVSPLLLYAGAEFLIGLGAFAVPELFSLGERWLLSSGNINSSRYLILSDIIIIVSVLPWCIWMGFTYPFMMSFIRRADREHTSGFSYLYCANAAGAICGTVMTAWILIELAGFHKTLFVAASCNFMICLVSLAVHKIYRSQNIPEINDAPANRRRMAAASPNAPSHFIYLLLFFTGFSSMAMEIIWTRAFTPILLNMIYSFSSLLAVYLFSTLAGILLYRMHLKRNRSISTGNLLAALVVFSFLPILLNDPRLIISIAWALASIFPFCATLGYLTPKIIDEYSAGCPDKAGKAYAVNIAGCIMGPVCASYILLPALGVKISLVLLNAPFLLLFCLYFLKGLIPGKKFGVVASSGLLMILISVFINISYEDGFIEPDDGLRRTFHVLPDNHVVRRDHTATVISTGEGMGKMLFINGIGTTHLTPITKMMAHLPLALCREKPQSALIICLGMGSTYRSALSWNIKATAVELVPSVKEAFGYYFADADKIMNNPRGRIVIDDGRRFLKRSTEMFDVITIDPPPPLESSGSSLLYSKEFYDLTRRHLKKNGILHQWFPCGEFKIAQAITRALSDAFPHIRVYQSVEGWGLHFLASQSPIDVPVPQIVLSRIPEEARKDMMEWYPVNQAGRLEDFIRFVFRHEISIAELLNEDETIIITDDKPFNEYFFLRRTIDMRSRQYLEISCWPSLNDHH